MMVIGEGDRLPKECAFAVIVLVACGAGLASLGYRLAVSMRYGTMPVWVFVTTASAISSGIAGCYLLLLGRPRAALLMNIYLILSIVWFRVNGVGHEPLPLSFFLRYEIQDAGFGINLIGLPLVVWYSRLRRFRRISGLPFHCNTGCDVSERDSPVKADG